MFTYDLSTDVGKLRLLIVDTKDDGHVFEDDELEYCLSSNNNNIGMAAYTAYGILIRDRARLALRVKTGRYETVEQAISELLKLQKELKSESIGGGLQVGTLDGGDEILSNWRPTWTDPSECAGC